MRPSGVRPRCPACEESNLSRAAVVARCPAQGGRTPEGAACLPARVMASVPYGFARPPSAPGFSISHLEGLAPLQPLDAVWCRHSPGLIPSTVCKRCRNMKRAEALCDRASAQVLAQAIEPSAASTPGHYPGPPSDHGPGLDTGSATPASCLLRVARPQSPFSFLSAPSQCGLGCYTAPHRVFLHRA